MEIDKLNTQEEEDDGPPPGFQSITNKAIVKEDEEDGPPPGFAPIPSSQNKDKEERNKQDDIDEEGDDGGPPPGWKLVSLSCALPEQSSTTTDVEIEKKEELNVDEEDEDAPPPGWKKISPHQMPPPCVPQPHQSSTVENYEQEPQIVSEYNLIGQSPEPLVQQTQPSVLLDTKREETKELNVDEEDGDGPPPGWENISPHKPPVQQPQPSTHSDVRGKGETTNRIKRPSTGSKSVSPVSPSPEPAATASSTELAQLVCGACRKLCTYPRGSRWVQCPSCMEVNFAIEAHEIGQVKCTGCATLLMYPYGSPAVQCSSCSTVIEIDEHNMRAPLSVQHNQRRRHPNPAR